LDLADADLLVDARAVLLGGQRRLHRTTNGFCLLYSCNISFRGVPLLGQGKIGRNGE
jgi:hypothetical protein